MIANLLAVGLCLLSTFILLGFGLVLWFDDDTTATLYPATVRPTRRSIKLVELPPPPTATPTATVTSSPTPTPLPTGTSTPTLTPTPTLPPTDTPMPLPTNTPTPTSRPPTPTPSPTGTATPSPPDYPFAIKETGRFDTNHLNFDVYVGITDTDNKPLSDYWVTGTHDSGLQIKSQASAGDWTVNSGAMHYKAGNIKYEAPNSPSGVWTLQLVDPSGNPAAPPVEFAFDAANPTWYFLLYKLR